MFVDNFGYAVYAWFVRDGAGFNGAASARADFEAGYYTGRKSEEKRGMTTEGVIIGTFPRLDCFKPQSEPISSSEPEQPAPTACPKTRAKLR